MIVFDKDKKTLVIPSGLGNFSTTPGEYTPSSELERIEEEIANIKASLSGFITSDVLEGYAPLSGAIFTGEVKFNDDIRVDGNIYGNDEGGGTTISVNKVSTNSLYADDEIKMGFRTSTNNILFDDNTMTTVLDERYVQK